jgi:hypothetical protein
MVADQERRRHLEPEEMSRAQLKALVKDDSAACIDCHLDKSPGVVAQWTRSKHAEKGVGCLECHGAEKDDVAAWRHEGVSVTSIVTPLDCARCHPRENTEFAASHHNTAGLILHSQDNILGEFVVGGPNAVLGCKQCHGSQLAFSKELSNGETFRLDLEEIGSAAMKELKAKYELKSMKGVIPHKKELRKLIAAKVEEKWDPKKMHAPKENAKLVIDAATWPNSGMGRFNPDGSLGTCNACHSRHEFSKALARQPEACGKCHMGPDHPQIEIFNESKHGIAFRNKLSEMNLDDPEWVVGKDYSAAPTCATCHMSRYDSEEVNHDIGLRISWTLRPPISEVTTSHTATIASTGDVVERDVRWDEKRATMQRVCAACHSTSHVEGFYEQYDALVLLYNEKFARPGQKLMDYINHPDRHYLTKPTRKGFAHELSWVWFELWHHEGRQVPAQGPPPRRCGGGREARGDGSGDPLRAGAHLARRSARGGGRGGPEALQDLLRHAAPGSGQVTVAAGQRGRVVNSWPSAPVPCGRGRIRTRSSASSRRRSVPSATA